MTWKDARMASDVVVGMLVINTLQEHLLFDLGANHSFIANIIAENLGRNKKKGRKRVYY